MEKQIGRESVCCQMDQEAQIYFALGNQRKNQNAMKRNALVGKLGILEFMFYVIRFIGFNENIKFSVIHY